MILLNSYMFLMIFFLYLSISDIRILQFLTVTSESFISPCKTVLSLFLLSCLSLCLQTCKPQDFFRIDHFWGGHEHICLQYPVQALPSSTFHLVLCIRISLCIQSTLSFSLCWIAKKHQLPILLLHQSECRSYKRTLGSHVDNDVLNWEPQVCIASTHSHGTASTIQKFTALSLCNVLLYSRQLSLSWWFLYPKWLQLFLLFWVSVDIQLYLPP